MNSAPKLVKTAGLKLIERKIQGVFVSGLLALGVLGAVSYVGIEQLLAQSVWAEHSRQVIDTVRGMLGSVEDAEAARRGFEISGNQGFIEAFQRATREAGQALRELRTKYGPLVQVEIAEILAYRGEAARAFGELEAAVRAQAPGVFAIKSDSYFKPLRQDPRYGQLLRKLNLPS